jgi:predicted alpha/beta superfamily hydrolase
MLRIFTASIISIFLICAITVQAQIEDKISTGTPPEVKIAGTEMLSINSSITGKKYDLYVSLPASYSSTTKKYPVVYLLDAQWDFPLVQAIYGEQYYDGFINGLVVVGITWGGDNPNYDTLRSEDFTPTPTAENPRGGNSPKFLQFIKKELIPFIESKYRVKQDDRTLIGTSLGGLFSLYTVFNETNLFNRYVFTSPALDWDNGVIYGYEKEFAAKHKAVPAKMFMGVGAYEDTVTFKKFVEILKSRNYPGLSIKSKILEGVGHSGTKPLGYSWGLQSVFTKPTLDISTSDLKQFVGNYRVSPVKELRISVENNHLKLHDIDGSARRLREESPNNFYVNGVRLIIHFKKDASGKIEGMQIHRYTGDSFATLSTR